MAGERVDDSEIIKRIEEVRKRILAGHTSWNIVQWGIEAWEMSERQMRVYISRAKAQIKSIAIQSARSHLHEHIAARRELRLKIMETAMESGKAYDVTAALMVMQEEAKLLGLYSPDKLAFTNPDGSKEYGSESEDRRTKQIAEILETWRSREAAAAGEGGAVDPSDGATGTGVLQSG